MHRTEWDRTASKIPVQLSLLQVWIRLFLKVCRVVRLCSDWLWCARGYSVQWLALVRTWLWWLRWTMLAEFVKHLWNNLLMVSLQSKQIRRHVQPCWNFQVSLILIRREILGTDTHTHTRTLTHTHTQIPCFYRKIHKDMRQNNVEVDIVVWKYVNFLSIR